MTRTYTEDEVNAMVAAAYEAAAKACDPTSYRAYHASVRRRCVAAIHALTPADAKAALTRLLDAARAEERAKIAKWHEAKAKAAIAQAEDYRADDVLDGSIEACLSDALLHREAAVAIREFRP